MRLTVTANNPRRMACSVVQATLRACTGCLQADLAEPAVIETADPLRISNISDAMVGRHTDHHPRNEDKAAISDIDLQSHMYPQDAPWLVRDCRATVKAWLYYIGTLGFLTSSSP